MTLRTWPASVSCPVFQSDKHKIDHGLDSTEMVSGFLASRRLYDHFPGDYEAEYRVSVFEADLLAMFAHKVGAQEFYLKARLPGQLNEGYKQHRVKFRESGLQIGPPSVGYCRVSIKIRLMETEIDDYDLFAFQAAYGSDSLTFTGLFDTLANIEMPDHVGAP